jgi:hypothetical protein
MSNKRSIFVSYVVAMACLSSVALVVAPAAAADTRPPRITGAKMQDVDGDDKADRVVLTYNEKIKHPLDSDGSYPFKLSAPVYGIRRINGARGTRTLVILLKEKASPDLTARPDISFIRGRSQPVRDLAGNEAQKQTFTATVPQPCPSNATTDFYANPVVDRTRVPAPTGVSFPSYCSYATLTSALGALQATGGAGRVIASGAGSGTATFAAEAFPLSVPNGVTLTTSLDPDLGGSGLDATKYVVDFKGTATHAVTLVGGKVRGITLQNRRAVDASSMIVCVAGSSQLDASWLDGASTAGGQVNDGLVLEDGCTLSDEGPSTSDISQAVRVRNFADTGVVVGVGSTLSLGFPRIHNNGGDGLLVQGSAHIDRGEIAFNRDGIVADHSSTSSFHGLKIRDNRSNGVYIKTADVGFTSNEIWNNSRLDGWDEAQVLFDGPAPSTGTNVMMYWTGFDCVPVNDFIGLHADQCTVADGEIDPPPDAWYCTPITTPQTNRIHTYNTTDDLEFSVGMYAAGGAFVNADDNSWRTVQQTQNVDQSADSFVDADATCGGTNLDNVDTSGDPVT